MIVYDSRCAAFLEARLSIRLAPPFAMIGREHKGRIVAAACFNCFTGPDIEVTLAADKGRLSLPFLRACAAYVLDTCKAIRVSISTEDEAVARLAVRMGGKIEGRKRNAFGPGRDAIQIGILKEEWVFHEVTQAPARA